MKPISLNEEYDRERRRERVRGAIQGQLHHFHLAYSRWGKEVNHPGEVRAAEYAVVDAAIAAMEGAK